MKTKSRLTPARRKGFTAATTALLLIDVINDLDFKGSEGLVTAAERMARPLARLMERARESGVPVVYVNDNFGRWRSDWRAVVDRCLKPTSPGRRVAAALQPTPADFFVLKPRHSGFYSTSLEFLLKDLGIETVVIAGIATDICVLVTANDAFVRGLKVVVPRDCVAANTARKTAMALEQIRDVLKGETQLSTRLKFSQRRTARSGSSGSR